MQSLAYFIMENVGQFMHNLEMIVEKPMLKQLVFFSYISAFRLYFSSLAMKVSTLR